jgi:hypothetical protein
MECIPRILIVKDSSTDTSHSGVFTLVNLTFRWSSVGLITYIFFWNLKWPHRNFLYRQNEET